MITNATRKQEQQAKTSHATSVASPSHSSAVASPSHPLSATASPASSSSSVSVPQLEIQQQMVTQFSAKSGMNLQWSKMWVRLLVLVRCLKYATAGTHVIFMLFVAGVLKKTPGISTRQHQFLSMQMYVSTKSYSLLFYFLQSFFITVYRILNIWYVFLESWKDSPTSIYQVINTFLMTTHQD